MAGAALAAGFACSPSEVFVCTEDGDCAGSISGGRCEPDGYCSFVDDDCESGRRYGELAGGGKAGECTATPTASTTGASTSGSGSTTDLTVATTDTTSGSGTTGAIAETSGSTGDGTSGGACGEPGLACCADDPCPGGGSCIDDFCQDCTAQVWAGDHMTCALTNTGRLDCWGDNTYGQLGNGMQDDLAEPQTVPLDAARATTGATHGLAVGDDGLVYGWGRNNHEQAQPGAPNPALTVDSFDLSGANAALTAGRLHSCVLAATGRLTCWGRNGDGQLGVTESTEELPTIVPNVAEIEVIDAGGFHTCAASDSTVWCWGRNDDFQLGSETAPGGPEPVEVPLAEQVVALAAAERHTCAVDFDGSTLCWGRDNFGQTGDGNPAPDHGAPTLVVDMPPARTVDTGFEHSCAVSLEGEVFCWGRNADSQLGVDVGPIQPSALRVEGVSGAIDVATGREHTCASTAAGEVWCWGRNHRGQLGVDGANAAEPVLSDFVCDDRP